jgi:Spy/CpxP family protein refolding chaperone
MLTTRKVFPAICLVASLAGVAAYAATTVPPAGAPAPSAGGPHWHGHHHGFMGLVLHKLNLTDVQKTQVKAVFASEKSQFEALRASVKTNREALETTAPSSPGYPALVQQAQNNAVQRIKLESETWSLPGRRSIRSRPRLRPTIDSMIISAGPRRCRLSSADR